MPSPPLPTRIRSRADVELLLGAWTNYEEKRPRNLDRRTFDLARMEALLVALGAPHTLHRTIHVAGSKGKGTVVRLLAHGLDQAKAGDAGPIGLYTSPHLRDLAERIAFGRTPIDEDALARAGDALLGVVPELVASHGAPTFFELMTAMAWVAFHEANCSAVVLETGMGGRLDSTNVCAPSATAITTIELEHTRLLGDTLAKIAAEKAGILKAGVSAWTTARGEALDTIQEHAAAIGAPLRTVGAAEDDDVQIVSAEPGTGRRLDVVYRQDGREHALHVPLAGVHHAPNAALVASMLHHLEAPAAPAELLTGASLPGLLEPVFDDPLVLVDGAHTPTSARATRRAVREGWPERPVVLVAAVLEEKDILGVLGALAEDVVHVVLTRVASPRAVSVDTLLDLLVPATDVPITTAPNPAEAFHQALRLVPTGGLILASGSVYLAGDVALVAETLAR